MSKSSKSHALRRIVLVTAAVAIAFAVRQAVADKGGSYDPAS